MSATISPAPTLTETSSSALSPGKDFETCRSSSSASLISTTFLSGIARSAGDAPERREPVREVRISGPSVRGVERDVALGEELLIGEPLGLRPGQRLAGDLT